MATAVPTWRPARGTKWDTTSKNHALAVAAVSPGDPNRGPSDCFHCLLLPSPTLGSNHSICRVYEVLYARRTCWTNLRYLTALTHDITSDQYWFVQQCVSYLRRVYGLTVVTRPGRSPGGRYYRLWIENRWPRHPAPRRLWRSRVQRKSHTRLGESSGGANHHNGVAVPSVYPRRDHDLQDVQP
jgi:hypothetical protein